jgi:uncharacterized protein (TIGR02646 family)
MRYIPKGNEPNILSLYKLKQTEADLIATYDGFREKSALNEILRAEQKGICCYCMRVIDQYQGYKESSSHNEHLLPQETHKKIQLDYNNIYASCNDTNHCGHHKGNNEITNFIQQPNCREFFKYNTIGEILPVGAFEKYDDARLHPYNNTSR